MDRCKLSTFSFIPFSPFPPNDRVQNGAAVVAAVDGKFKAVEPVVDTGISCWDKSAAFSFDGSAEKWFNNFFPGLLFTIKSSKLSTWRVRDHFCIAETEIESRSKR